jgi:plastocyanin
VLASAWTSRAALAGGLFGPLRRLPTLIVGALAHSASVPVRVCSEEEAMRMVGVAIAVIGAIALVAAACGGTSSSDKTSTAAAGGVGGAAVTPVSTSGGGTSGSPTARASGSPTAGATAAKTGTAASGGATKLTLSTASGSTIAFDETTLNAPAGAQVTVTYNNMSNVAHNVHFFNGKDASAPSLGMTQVEAGPTTQTVSFTAPSTPGSYYFQCDVHPQQMNGMLVVQ